LSAGYVDAYYKKAVSARESLRKDLEDVFKKVDVIMGPTTPTVAWKLGEKLDDPLTMYLADIYTVVANLAGIPALSVPCGDVEGLPVGLQIMGPAGSDAKILDLGYWYERA
jgi:aspartyl-tRNA(Asn)/glutamyl-tRNA(Gln) amidotransferase subunit A